MRRIFSMAMVALLACLMVASCTSTNSGGGSEYATATQTYSADAARYVAAGDEIAAMHAKGKVTAEQWTRFVALQADVRAADANLYADLAAWKTSGAKPPGYDAKARILADAQQQVILLSAEVMR